MNVVGLEAGRITLLVDILELSPKRGVYVQELVAPIVDRYQFSLVPKNEDQSTETLRFEHGRMQDGEYIPLLEIYPQGIIVHSIDTAIGDAFLKDLFDTGTKEFGLQRLSPSVKKVYWSVILADFNSDIAEPLGRWERFFQFYNTKLSGLYGIETPASVQSIAIRPDPEKMQPRLSSLLQDFTLQRRIYFPYERQRFLSSAPLPTEVHVDMLKRLDKAHV